PRWEMAYPQFQLDLVGHLLQRHLPKPRPITVAATAVGGDQQFAGAPKALTAHALPPTPDRPRREVGRVVMNLHADPALVVGQVVNAVGNGFAQGRVLEIVNADFLGFAL